MKKILPLFIICLFVLTGLGANATIEKENTPQPLQPPELVVGLRGTWFGIEVTILNDGEDFPGETINVTVTVDGPIVLLNQVTATPIPIPDPGLTGTFRTGMVIGFGPIITNVAVEYHGDIVASAESNGFLFIVLVSFEPIPIP